MNTNVAGVVLAAGLSRRMGQPKALIKLGEFTFLENMCHALAAGGCTDLIAITNQHIHEACLALGLEQVRFIINPEPDAGQISSLRIALEQTEHTQAMLFTTVDQAHLKAQTVLAIKQHATQNKIVVARHNQQAGHPTAFGQSFYKALRSSRADTGARNIIADYPEDIIWVDIFDPGIVRNINTPTDLQNELQHWSNIQP